MQWVFDASVTLAWCFEDERTDATEALLDRLVTTPAAVPQLWPLEIANVLTLGVRESRLSPAQRAQFVAMLESVPVHVDPFTSQQALGVTMALADTYQLTAYDAAYLELAMRLGVPLASLDGALLAAARTAGVPLL